MIRLVGAVLVAWALTESSAFAHKLLVDCRVVGQELKIDVFYEDDSPADGAKIQLFLDETPVWSTKADDDGRLVKPAPMPGEYELRVEHYGHMEKKLISIESGEILSSQTNGAKEPGGTRQFRLLIGLALIVIVFGCWRWIKSRNST